MTSRLIIGGLFAVLLAGSAQAILPPDAARRAPQIRAEYMRRERAHQEDQAQQTAVAIEQYQKTEAAIYTPPWKRAELQAAVPAAAAPAGAGISAKSPERNHRFLISVVFLIAIGASAVWVRHKTRETDK